ncbi:hypothetical protein [Hugenholtzia roseola]|uniref:hypothetical protein n=1 Tax=Hugenholtzia roseola TaxID=1002 RepID=UPI0003F81A2E|nr:hypothetical protein [Hugenholtzia roseola]
MDNEYDKFRKVFQEYEPAFSPDADWEKMRQKLDEDNRRQFLFRIGKQWGTALVAACLTMAVATTVLYQNLPQESTQENKEGFKLAQKQANRPNDTQNRSQNQSQNQSEAIPDLMPSNLQAEKDAKQAQLLAQATQTFEPKQNKTNQTQNAAFTTLEEEKNEQIAQIANGELSRPAALQIAFLSPELAQNAPHLVSPPFEKKPTTFAKPFEQSLSANQKPEKALALSLGAGIDLQGGFGTETHLAFSTGAGFWGNLKKGKVSLAWGLLYRKNKLKTLPNALPSGIASDFDNLGNAEDIVAMWKNETHIQTQTLEVPLLLQYQVLQNEKISLHVGTGLLNLYHLQHTERARVGLVFTDETDPRNTRTEFHNQYKESKGELVLAAATQIQAGLTFKPNSRFKVQVEPYWNIPLRPFGSEGVFVQKTGVTTRFLVGI